VSKKPKLPENVLCYGVEEPLPQQVPLCAGPLELVFEAGDLRWIRLGSQEVVRRIYVAVRDRNWGTVPNRISNLSVRVQPTRFEILYDVENREREIDFRWAGRIVGDETGTITFSMRGTARTAFLKNRIGFCVLHPIRECAGQTCTVTKEDGTVEEGQFPSLISPDQPFRDYRALAHPVDADTSVEFRFEGDIFEMEDQRNWTDASFKTYSTPLRLPYPAPVAAGTVIEQTVRVRLVTIRKRRVRAAGPRATSFSFNPAESTPLPGIGLGVTTGTPELDQRQIALLRRLNLSHLRVDLDVGGPYRPVLERAIRDAAQIGVPLEVALMLSGDSPEFQPVVQQLANLDRPVVRWLVFNRDEKSTSTQSVRAVRDCLTALSLPGQLVSGTNAYFAELNRRRPQTDLLDGVCYSVNPQVHAFDNESLVENLAAQGHTVESARHFAGGRPIYVSPVTLRPRFNPNATGPETARSPGQLPSQVDVRQMSLFGAAWTVGSLKYLSEAGVAGITYYETCGWRGVVETGSGSPLPARFRSIPGGVFPLYHVLADAGELKGGEVLRSESSAPLLIDGMVLRRGDRLRILIVNMRRDPRLVVLRLGNLVTDVQIRVLDQTNAERAMDDPDSFRLETPQPAGVVDGCLELTLSAYAVARIDGRWS